MIIVFSSLMFILLTPAVTQEGPAVVKLCVVKDGKEVPAPTHVMLYFAGQSREIPVVEGKFEVPPEVVKTERTTLATEIEGEQIRISGIHHQKFRSGKWTIIMATRNYTEEFQWVVPKGTKIRESCILEFEPNGGEGTATFVSKCRKKL